LTEASLEEKLTSLDENKKVEAIKKVANTATKQCQRSIASSIKKNNDLVENKKEEDNVIVLDDVKVENKKEEDNVIVIDDVKEKKQLATRKYSLQKSIVVHKDNVKCTSIISVVNQLAQKLFLQYSGCTHPL